MDRDTAALAVATLALLLSIISLFFYVRQLQREHTIRTLEYVSSQFDRLGTLGAREELRKMSTADILSYVDTDPSPAKTQRLMEYVYTFNRIAVGLRTRSLSEDVLFSVWPPRWFEAHWSRFAPLVARERGRPGRRDSFGIAFEWLALERCPQVRAKYPELAGERPDQAPRQ